jgi:phosphohistidine phosphatase
MERSYARPHRGDQPAPIRILPSVRVYLCRHAKAAAGDPDELRPLTADGRTAAEELGERLAALADPPALVLSSPLLRARETAEAIAAASGAELRIEPLLSPGVTEAGLREAVAGCPSPVVTVGHQPDCSEIALALTGRDPGFPPAGMLALDL